MTERLHFHFSVSCIEEGNGNPLQCSCLENPRDEGAWWAAVSGVAQSRTRLKRLSSSRETENKGENERKRDLQTVTITLEKAMALHYSTLAWKIPWTEEPGRLQSRGL